jgi:hypothetical protein
MACKWLFSMVDMENEQLAELKWSDFKDIFKQE